MSLVNTFKLQLVPARLHLILRCVSSGVCQYQHRHSKPVASSVRPPPSFR